jgi:hypothetical protein
MSICNEITKNRKILLLIFLNTFIIYALIVMFRYEHKKIIKKTIQNKSL